jgi:hypothetical protein
VSVILSSTSQPGPEAALACPASVFAAMKYCKTSREKVGHRVMQISGHAGVPSSGFVYFFQTARWPSPTQAVNKEQDVAERMSE